jgi:hypothetical protein
MPWYIGTRIAAVADVLVFERECIAAVAQLVRALACHARGCRFDPGRPRRKTT